MTQILKNNHKSGINENNITVATVTEAQKTRSAINSLLITQPIRASVQVYQVNSTTNDISYPDQPECSNKNYIFCKVTVTAVAKFKTISKALLKIRKYSGSEVGFSVYPSGESIILLNMDNTNYLKTVTKSGVKYAVIDISDYVKDGKSKVFYIAIKSEKGNSICLYNTASVEVSYVEDNDLISSGKLEKQVGANGGYSINARNGKLQYVQQIFASKGGLMPFNLSLSYNASNCNSSSPNGVANGMKGWTFNYQQSLKQSLNEMLYVDASNIVHTFKHPTNDNTVWYDATGKNGMVLTESNGEYTMSDGQTSTLKFDTSKRLVSVVQKLSSSKNAATTVEYESDGKISSVKDGLDDVYEFKWTDTGVTISKDGTSFAVITLTDEKVTQIKYGSDKDTSANTVDFTYDTSGQLVSVLDSASNQRTLFEYNSIGAISAVKNHIKNTDNDQVTYVATDSNHFEYNLLQTCIANCRNSDNKGKAYCKMEYLFAEDGELLTTAEVKSDTLTPLRYRTKKDFEKSSDTLSNEVLAQALFSSEETVETTDSITSDTFTLDTRNQVFNRYMFSASALISASDNVSNDGSQKLTVEILDNNEILGSAEFDPSKREGEVVCGYITLSQAQHTNMKARLTFQDLNAKVTFGNVKLYSTKYGVQKQCVNVETGLTQTTEKVDSTSKFWYEEELTTIKYGSTEISDVAFTSTDYILTLISRLQDSTNYNVWYNDGKNMLHQVSGVTLTFNGIDKSIQDIQVCTLSSTVGKTLFEYVEPDSTYLYKTCKATTFSVDDVLSGTVSEQYVNADFQTVKVVDDNGITTEYTYDANGSATTVKTTATTDSLLNIVENSTYDDNNLLKTSKSRRYLVDYTQSYTYGSDYRLTNTTAPNSQVTNFEYLNDTENLTQISSELDETTSFQNDISYEGDLVDTLSDNRTTVDFDYDERHNISKVKIANTAVLEKTITYDEYGTTQSVTTYGNGQKIKKYYDKYDRLIKVSDVTSGETLLLQYIYSDYEIDKTNFDSTTFSPVLSANSPLRVVIDHAAGTKTWYTYDELGQVKKTQNEKIVITQTKDQFNRVSSVTSSFSGGNMNTSYTYTSPTNDTLVAEKIVWDAPGEISTTYTNDGLQRLTDTTVMVGSNGYKQSLEYIPRQVRQRKRIGTQTLTTGKIAPVIRLVTVEEGTTNNVSAFKEYTMSGTTATLARTDNVEYDANGNITKYGDVTYEYDKLDRLVRENNLTLDKTITWCYDVSGNILSRTEYAYTTDTLGTPTATYAYTYSNSWKDQLTSFNGQSIVYDKAGNPTTYKGAKLTWTRGRLLNKYNSIVMQYDANGIRRQKTVPETSSSTTTEYLYSGNNLLQEKITTSSSSKYKFYLYNSQGIIGYIYNGTTYMYRKNLFGDIVAIYSGATKLAEYTYDAWGNCTIVSDTDGIGASNPFRYRGYYWDKDLNLYYLINRYYDPQVGRFINADSLEYLDPETLGGLNLYAYCLNNPVMDVDPDGTSTLVSILKIVGSLVLVGITAAVAIHTGNVVLAGAAIGGLIGIISGIIVDVADGEYDLESIADAMVSGALTGMASGALAATGVGVGGQMLGNALIMSADYVITSCVKGEEIDPAELFGRAAIGAASGFVGGSGLMHPSNDMFGRITVEIIRQEGIDAANRLLVPLMAAAFAGSVLTIIKNIREK